MLPSEACFLCGKGTKLFDPETIKKKANYFFLFSLSQKQNLKPHNMQTASLTKYLFTAAVISLIIISCKKKENPAPVTTADIAAATHNQRAEAIFNDVCSISDQAAGGILTSYMQQHDNNGENRGVLSSCASIIVDETISPHKITVSFGSSGSCICADGRKRVGEIYISYNGSYHDHLSPHSITFYHYAVNDFQITGTVSVTNNGYNIDGHLTFSQSVNAQITSPGGAEIITWNSNHTREWIQGEATPGVNDDVYLITGSTTGIDAAGNSFTSTIVNPLRKAVNCAWIESGVLQMTSADGSSRSINYGNGDCDDKAVISSGGSLYNFTLQ